MLNLVDALELKIPPVAVILVFAVAMWLVSAYEPSLALVLPWRTSVAAAFIGLGVLISLAGYWRFARPTQRSIP
jgi:hypothetical protein